MDALHTFGSLSQRKGSGPIDIDAERNYRRPEHSEYGSVPKLYRNPFVRDNFICLGDNHASSFFLMLYMYYSYKTKI